MSSRYISWGVKAAGAYGWQPYHLHVPIVLKYESLDLLEPSGPVHASIGIALPVTFTSGLPVYACSKRQQHRHHTYNQLLGFLLLRPYF